MHPTALAFPNQILSAASTAAAKRSWQARVALLSMFLGSLTACKEDRPYTPFQVASALPSAPALPTIVPPEPSAKARPAYAPAIEIQQAKAATWQVDNRSFQAPPDYEFERALLGDFDSDGKKELVAWNVPKSDLSKKSDLLKRPELWLYRAQAEPKKLWSLPGFVPTGPSCGLNTSLKQSGPETVVLDVTGNCEARLIERAPVRSIAVIAPLRERTLVLALRAATGGPQEQFKLALTSPDQDGDGRDDVILNVTVQGKEASSRATTVKFVWYDRPAGASRDDSEPGVSLARAASTEIVRAKGKTTSLAVPGAIQNLRRVYGDVCAEAGTPRLFDAEGNGLGCGRLTTTFQRMHQAELSAMRKNGQTLEALGALVRNAWFGYPATDKETTESLALFGSSLVQRKAMAKARLDLDLVKPPSGPHFSPLDFQPDGTLLIQSANELKLATRDGALLDAAQLAELPKPWPLAVVSNGGRIWTRVVHSCDRAEVSLSFAAGDGRALSSETTDILAPRPGSCAGGRDFQYPRPVPLGWAGEQLLAWVDGSRVGPKQPDQRPRGSALSPDGRWLVVPTQLGLLVSSSERTELWRLPETLGPSERLTGCTISDSAARVACVFRGQAVVIAAEDVSGNSTTDSNADPAAP